jgi:hypothetical protein
VILGSVFFWLLAAIFGAIGFWWQVLIGIGAAFVYLQTLKKPPDKWGKNQN